jgi:hypothetical protein
MIILSKKEEFRGGAEDAHYFLDITEEVGPFTFGHKKLLMERPKPGEIAEIGLNAGECAALCCPTRPCGNRPPTGRRKPGDGLHRLSSRKR